MLQWMSWTQWVRWTWIWAWQEWKVTIISRHFRRYAERIEDDFYGGDNLAMEMGRHPSSEVFLNVVVFIALVG